MLFYLDNWLSVRPGYMVRGGPNQGRLAGLNENYARELMELHTLGVDGGYSQSDVTEVARAFTGWTIERPRQDARFLFRPATHDFGDKRVLGRVIRVGGERDAEQVLDLLAAHPATARFIAGKLTRRFVSDEVPPALIDRVAAAYATTGGDIRAMLRVIFAAPEFRAPQTAGAKIKKPSEFVASAARAMGATVDARGALALARATAEIGEGLYEAAPPTGHPDRAEAWVNPGALLARMNFALALANGRLPGVRVDVGTLVGGADRGQPNVVLDHLLAALLHGRASEQTRAVLTAQLGLPEITRLTADDRGPANTDVAKLAALVLGSPTPPRRAARSWSRSSSGAPSTVSAWSCRTARRATTPPARASPCRDRDAATPPPPSISTASSRCTPRWRRCCRCGSPRRSRSCRPAARPTSHARTSMRRTTWRAAPRA